MTTRIACAACAAVLIALALTVLRPAPASGGGSLRDFQVYYAAGAVERSGGDPYSAAIVADEPMLSPGAMLPFVGVPATLPFWRALSLIPFARAAVLWQGVLLCALLGLIAGTALFARSRGAFDVLCVALAALAFAPITSALALGQTVIVAAAAAALAMGLRTLPALAAGSFVAFAVQPNAALGLLSMLRRGGAFALASAFLAIYLCNALVAGALWPVAYMRTLGAHAAAERDSILQFTPFAVAHGFGAPPALAAIFALACGLAAATVAVFIAWRARDDRSGFIAICCALPFVCGFFHAHDFSAIFAASLVTLRGRAPGTALFAMVLLGANWLDFAQMPSAFSQDLALGAALIAACLSFVPRLDVRTLGWAGASLTLLGLGAWLAVTHPIAVWPDAMRSLSLPANASAAELWHVELAHTGLLDPHPASALLRLLALAGCGLLLALTAKASDVDVHHVVERRDGVGMEVL